MTARASKTAERDAAPGPYTYVWTKTLSAHPIRVHRVSEATDRTACGIWTYSPTGGYDLGDYVPFRALNPALVRLCGHCWRGTP